MPLGPTMHAGHDLENVDPMTGLISTVRPTGVGAVFPDRKDVVAGTLLARMPFVDLTTKTQTSGYVLEGPFHGRPVTERRTSERPAYLPVQRPVQTPADNEAHPLFPQPCSYTRHAAGPTASNALRKMR
ncbi:hypothetical protein PLESTM_001516500 [Pleodorina starrii]|nr:hypothetical protein PLESTM_001516500 [Pleodorina starrii]